jgi:hypothetical protein
MATDFVLQIIESSLVHDGNSMNRQERQEQQQQERQQRTTLFFLSIFAVRVESF